MFHQLCREFALLEPLAAELIALASEHGLTFWQALGRLFRGSHLLETGQAQAGLEDLRAGIAGYRATSGLLYLPYALTLLAQGCRRVGDHGAASQAIAEAKTLVESTGVRGFEPYVYRVEATVLLDGGADASLVEASLQHAVEVARRQRARTSELRATIELARLWQGQGRIGDASALLRPLHDGFTEGFNGIDLREARQLLDALG
jgi:adenylate cyclase